MIINKKGAIVGTVGTRIARWNSRGDIAFLAPPPNFSSAWPVGMNDDGVIIGHGNTNVMMQEHPIRWDAQGRATDLGDLGYLRTWANSINSKGVIVGRSEYGGNHPGSTRDSIAAKWDTAGRISNLGAPVGA